MEVIVTRLDTDHPHDIPEDSRAPKGLGSVKATPQKGNPNPNSSMYVDVLYPTPKTNENRWSRVWDCL